MQTVEGTENYKVFENMGDACIIDYKVSDENGSYTLEQNWNVNASRKEKTSKYGIVENNNSIELCYGLGEYGYHTYTMQYTIVHFVDQYQGNQAINQQFMSEDLRPQKFNIRITGFESFSEDNAEIYAFGFTGNIVFEKGAIVVKNTDNSIDYVSVLIGLNEDFCTNPNRADEDKSYQYIKKEALSDSDYQDIEEVEFVCQAISTDIKVQEDGSAYVKEEFHIDSSTAGYIKLDFYAIDGKTTVSNFKVSNPHGELQEVSSWEDTINEGVGKYRGGSEYNQTYLYFGIEAKDNQIYTVEYSVAYFIAQFDDIQGIKYTVPDYLMYTETNTNYIKMKDYTLSVSGSHITKDEVYDVYIGGYEGKALWEEDTIYSYSEGNYISAPLVLIGFKDNHFSNTNTYYNNPTFEEQVRDIKNGVYHSTIVKGIIERILESVYVIFGGIIIIVIFLIRKLIMIPYYLKSAKDRRRHRTEDFPKDLVFKDGISLPTRSEVPPFRDIPCQKDIFTFYYIAQIVHIAPNGDLCSGLLSAILLKYIKEGKIQFNKSKKGYCIDVSNTITFNHNLEQIFYKIIQTAAGADQILEEKEFNKWCKRNPGKIKQYFNKVESDIKWEWLKVGDGTHQPGDDRYVKSKYSEKIREQIMQVAGFRKFLTEFTLMDDKQVREVHIWEEYLIFASILGIADQVEKEIGRMCPNFKQESRLRIEDSRILREHFSEPVVTHMSKAYGRMTLGSGGSSSGSSRSSGSGGSSSSSGGSSYSRGGGKGGSR